MHDLICPRCGTGNRSGMAFCTNCGQSLAAPAARPPVVQSVPPNASPSVSPSVAPSQVPTVAMNAAAPAKSNKALIFGLLGCGGLLVVSVIGLIAAGAFIGMREVGQANVNANVSNTNSLISNSRVYNANGTTIEQLESGALDEMRSLKQVGDFRQVDVKTVPAGDSYPSASEAVQATYQKGKQSVVSTAAQFPSNEAALADFDARMKSVKEAGGKVYNNMNKEGTKGSAYKYKEYFFIEACGEAICWRNYSSELNAVRNFAVNFPGSADKKRK